MNPKNDNSPDRKRPEDFGQDDLFVQQLFDSRLNVDPPKKEFVDQLSRQLDAEFASVMSTADATTGDDHNQNGHGLNGRAAKQPTVDLASAKAARDPDDRSGNFSRWFGGVVAAAILLGMFAFWTVQPPTSWAEMIEALKSAPWVQTDSGRTSSWMSASSGVLARREVGQTTFASRRAGTYLNYVRDEAKIYRSDFDQDWQPVDQQLIAWLADSASGSIDPDANWKIVSESAVRVDDASGRWLKLTVVFESSEPARQVFTAVFTINPETKMPVSCQVQEGSLRLAESKSDRSWQSVSFDYPDSGPADVYDLGVASNTPIVQVGVDSEAAFVNANVARAMKALPVNELATVEPKRNLKTVDSLKLSENLKTPELKKNQEKPNAVEPKESKAAKTAAVADSKTEPVSLDPASVATATTVPIIPIPSSSLAMASRIDQLVDELWTENEVTPVAPANDETFLRRVYLDVIGRVPTVAEYDQFFEMESEDRRSQLIDELLDSREHALHMGGIWKRVLVPDDETAISRLGGAGKLEQWLSDSFAENKPYDELVEELLLAEGRVNESGPLLFYAAAKMNAEELAARTSRTFLGMRMECAECHDHPFDHWSQKDFWALAAYFAQISRPQGKIEMVSPVLRVRDAEFGSVKIPETDIVVEPSLPVTLHGGHGMTEADIEELKSAEITDGSRREKLAAWITHPKNSHFAQATVNRIWGHLFGQGLVDPVDDMGGHNLPASPQLLNQLGRYFVQSGFDLREVMRVLLNSRAYQLSSENEQETSSQEVRYFARIPLKPLTAEQLYDCLSTATGRTDLGRQVAVPTQLTIASNVDRFSDPGRAAFLAQFRTSIDQRTDYQAGIPQALTLMNGPMIASATSDAPKGILRSLSAPFFDDQTRIERLFIAALTRKPTDKEKKRYTEFFEGQEDEVEKSEVLGDVLWVLLNSAEFTMNH
jgi:hypothetical protein